MEDEVITVRSMVYLALTYDHFIAAGDSIVVLMKGIWSAYRGTAEPRARPLLRYPVTPRRLFRVQPRAAVRGIRRMREMVASCRRSVRPRYPGGADPRNAFPYCRIEARDLPSAIGHANLPPCATTMSSTSPGPNTAR